MICKIYELDIVNHDAMQKYITLCSNISADDEYTEKHHILPKSLFPEYQNLKNHSWNCAKLSYKNHIMAHYYFAVAINTRSAWAPLMLMIGKTIGHKHLSEADIIDLADYQSVAKAQMRTTPVSQETRDKLRSHNLGKKHTLQTREKMRASKTGVKLSLTHRAALVKAQKERGHPHAGKYPWQSAKAKKRGSDKLWIHANDVYRIWLANNKPKYPTMRKLFVKEYNIDIFVA